MNVTYRLSRQQYEQYLATVQENETLKKQNESLANDVLAHAEALDATCMMLDTANKARRDTAARFQALELDMKGMVGAAAADKFLIKGYEKQIEAQLALLDTCQGKVRKLEALRDYKESVICSLTRQKDRAVNNNEKLKAALRGTEEKYAALEQQVMKLERERIESRIYDVRIDGVKVKGCLEAEATIRSKPSVHPLQVDLSFT